MQIGNGSVSFNKHKGSGPRSDRTEVVFTTPVTQASAIVRGLMWRSRHATITISDNSRSVSTPPSIPSPPNG